MFLLCLLHFRPLPAKRKWSNQTDPIPQEISLKSLLWIQHDFVHRIFTAIRKYSRYFYVYLYIQFNPESAPPLHGPAPRWFGFWQILAQWNIGTHIASKIEVSYHFIGILISYILCQLISMCLCYSGVLNSIGIKINENPFGGFCVEKN